MRSFASAMETPSTEHSRSEPITADESKMGANTLIRVLTMTTTSTTNHSSDMESLADEIDQDEFSELDYDSKMKKHSIEGSLSSPLEAMCRRESKRCTKQKKAMTRRRRVQQAYLLFQIKKTTEFASSPEGIHLRRKRLECFGEMGMALFAPIEGAVGESRDEVENLKIVSEQTLSAMPRSEAPIDERAEFSLGVCVVPDDDSIPHLLSERVMLELFKVMPTTLNGRSWTRLFSITRDGDTFGTFISRVERNAATVIVVQTTRGEIVGGFADTTWGFQGVEGNFFGAGTSFLFSLVRSDEHSDPLKIYRWRGANYYSQFCRPGCIGMGGGGGSFGLFLQDDFTKGSSGPCETFGNPGPLTSSQFFDVLNFEVYGFSERCL